MHTEHSTTTVLPGARAYGHDIMTRMVPQFAVDGHRRQNEIEHEVIVVARPTIEGIVGHALRLIILRASNMASPLAMHHLRLFQRHRSFVSRRFDWFKDVYQAP